MVITYIRNILLLCVLYSCSGNSGEISFNSVKDRATAINDSCSEVTRYYRNGIVRSQGYICNGERNGSWKEFYSDGSLKWEGNYKMGYRELVDVDSVIAFCEFEFDDTIGFSVGKPRQCRIRVTPFNPKDLIIYINQGSFDSAITSGRYDFTVTPSELEDLCIEVLYAHRPNYTFCKQCYPVNPAAFTRTPE